MKDLPLASNLRMVFFAGVSVFMLSGCDMDKNLSLCAKLGMCNEEKVEQDAMCEHYGTCKKEDGEEDEKDEKDSPTQTTE